MEKLFIKTIQKDTIINKPKWEPDYTDLPLDQYISVIEIANPMHSLWSDGRWNKLTMAHGCYWENVLFVTYRSIISKFMSLLLLKFW